MHFISHLFLFIVAAGALCPFEDDDAEQIVLREYGTNTQWGVEVEFLDEGSSSCAYHVRWAGHDGYWLDVDLVARTPRAGADGVTFPEREIEALRAIGDLRVHGQDEDRREWMLVTQHPGTVATETALWQDTFPEGCNKDYHDDSIDDCIAFMDRIYAVLANRAVAYARSGYDYQGQNFFKFLFNADMTQVNFLGWKDAARIDPTENNLEWVRNRFMNFGRTSNLPVVDREDDSGVQGVCDSWQRYMAGKEWVEPWNIGEAGDPEE